MANNSANAVSPENRNIITKDGILDLEQVLHYIQDFRNSDTKREELIQLLFQENIRLRGQLNETIADFENETRSRREYQSQLLQSENQLKAATSDATTNPFVLVVIDGEGMVFTDELFHAGGGEAASKLHTDIKSYISSKYPHFNNAEIVFYMFANTTSLTNKLLSCGALEKPPDFKNFIHGFNCNQSLFNFIDVREKIDGKMKETIELFINNSQCQHILFGGCHDPGYLPFLEQYKSLDVASKITLIQCPAESSVIAKYKALNFPTMGFWSIFRKSTLVERAKPASSPAVAPATVARRESGNSWIAVSNDGKGKGLTPVSSNSKEPHEAYMTVYLNAKSERIDIPLPRVDNAAMVRVNNRIQSHGKYCNEFHLTGKCNKKGNCSYIHGERLTGAEQLALRTKARNAPCSNGSDCPKAGCFYGHHCPNAECLYDNCYFKGLHQTDTTPAQAFDENGNELPL